MVVVKNQVDTHQHHHHKINRSVDILNNTSILIDSINVQRHSTSSLDDHYLFSLANNTNNTTTTSITQSLVAVSVADHLNVEDQCEHEIKEINTKILVVDEESLVSNNNMSYLNSYLNISPSPSSSSTSSTSNNNNNQTTTTTSKTAQQQTNKQERNNSISSTNGSDDLDDLVINKDGVSHKDDFDNVIITDDEDEILDSNRLKNSSKSNIIEEEDEEENDLTPTIFHKSNLNNNQSSNFKLSHNRSSSNPFSIACEVASLSSMTSNYSQFDFLNNNNNNYRHMSPSPPPPPPTPKSSSAAAKSSNSLTSFFFANSLFNKKTTTTNSKDSDTQQLNIGTKTSIANNTSSNNNALDLIASKLLSLKPSSSQSSKLNYSSSTTSSNSSTSSTGVVVKPSDTQSIKSNHSAQNLYLNGTNATDLKITSSCLIFENRPMNLPAKSQQEAAKHKQEYEKMVEIAKKKELKEKELKLKKYEQQLKKEDFLANSLHVWNNEILKNWNELKSAKRTQQLWWHGLPPSIRGKVWRLAIGNDLNLTKDTYLFYEKKAFEKLEQLSKQPESATTSSVELIKLDVSRTFPQLCFFQRDGPLHNALHSVLGAYACYNHKIGYVQGMSFLTAILLLNMEAADAFICLANLLNTKYLLACFCMNQSKMNRYFRVHEILFEHNIPKLYRHFEEQKVKPDLYLIEWIFTLFSKSLNIEATSRIWDMFFRDQEEFLFRAALGILNMYKETLLEMDFIHIVQFLTKLPENINTTQLFKSIEQISTNIDDAYFTFKNLVDEVINNQVPTVNSPTTNMPN